MINKSIIAGLLSGALLVTTVSPSFASANVQEDKVNSSLEVLEVIQSNQEFREIMKSSILENKEDFNNPAYADYLIEDAPIQTMGKVTLTAKAGAKALKAAMDNIGEKAWNKTVKTVEDNFGVSLVVFHWQSMNKLINVLSNSHTTITEAITDFLVENAGFNRTFAEIITRAFVTVFL